MDQDFSPNIDPRLYEEAGNGPQAVTDGTNSPSIQHDNGPDARTHNADYPSTTPALPYTLSPLNNYPYPPPNHNFSGTATNYTPIYRNIYTAGVNGSGYGDTPPADDSGRLTSIYDPPTQALQDNYNRNRSQNDRSDLDRRQARVTARAEFELASSFQRGKSRETLGTSTNDTFGQNEDEGAHIEDELDNDLSSNEGSEEDDVAYDRILSQVSDYKASHVLLTRGRDSSAEGSGEDVDTSSLQQQSDEFISHKKPKRHRGPRAAVEPTGDIKLRLGKANECFQNNDIEGAKIIVDEIIRINAETYEAWVLLSSVFQERQQFSDALMALEVAAHLRPKHVEAWFNCAEYALYSMGEQSDKLLKEAQFCYAMAIRNVPNSLEARRRKAGVYVLRGMFRQAAAEYAFILKSSEYDLTIIRELAVVYVDLGEFEAGVDLYRKVISHFRSDTLVEDDQQQIDWNDLHSYAVLYESLDPGTIALKELKSHARWLLGREDEDYWDEVVEDDCEWDLDDSRRVGVPRYTSGIFPAVSYGLGLPIELRVSLGKLRLKLGHYEEALRHFSWLYATDGSQESTAASHPHLVLDVANALVDAGRQSDAIIFFRALCQVPGEMTASAMVQMAKCLIREELVEEAEVRLLEACKLDERHIEARIELARLFERLDESEQAFIYVNQVLDLESEKKPRIYRARKRIVHQMKEKAKANEKANAKSKSNVLPSNKASRQIAEQREEANIAMHLWDCYRTLQTETQGMREGEAVAMDLWMEAAQELTEDFRSCKSMYPWDRKDIDVYSTEDQQEAKKAFRLELASLARYHASLLDVEVTNDEFDPIGYRRISFQEWLTIFSEYGLCLARRGRNREAYDVCEAAIHAVIFCFSRADIFALHVCYCMCALIANDEETCVGIARWFMVQYQFATDSYRLFGAITRMCHAPVSWYNSGPTQKFILRQIKAMDYTLTTAPRREKYYKEKAGYTHRNDKGEVVMNEDLNLGLLMTYGHILAMGQSFGYAMNYYYRAYALDSANPMINLSLGLAYIQYGVKRQSENRQHNLLQGLTFIHAYYEHRKDATNSDERQEANYNLGRVYHLLGLTHLAIPYYKRVLTQAEADKEEKPDGDGENIATDAAYNLQTIYVMAGNMELAQSTTKKWLVI